MTSLVFEVIFSLTRKFSSLPKEVALHLKDARPTQLSKPHRYHLTSKSVSDGANQRQNSFLLSPSQACESISENNAKTGSSGHKDSKK